MMEKNFSKVKLGMFLLLVVLLIASVSAAYQRSYPAYSAFQNQGFFGSDSSSLEFDDELCGEVGQDFIVQIAPFGCEPAVVRQDLLEEQNVPVFCQLAATKINPLIDVEAIESLTFQGGYPPEVAGIGFQPARAAIGGTSGRLNRPILNNIGYAVIVLKKQDDPRNLPEVVQGNITARIKYDIKNAFGIGKASSHLPILTEDEWEDRRIQYGFWNGKGFLRADEIEGNSAVISLYDDTRKLQSIRLSEGETSNKIALPGFNCFANLQLRLNELSAPDTRARLRVNSEVFELGEGEVFLDGKCSVKDIDKRGFVESVVISCKEDDSQSLFRTSSFELSVSPRVTLKISEDGGKTFKTGNYSLGDKLYEFVDSKGEKDGRFVYLGFIGESGDQQKQFVVPVISTATSPEEFMQTFTFQQLPKMLTASQWSNGGLVPSSLESVSKAVLSIVGTASSRVASGDVPLGLVYSDGSFTVWPTAIPLAELTTFSDAHSNDVTFIGFSGVQNAKITDAVRAPYTFANDDYEDVLRDFSSEVTESSGDNPAGGQALLEEINLANGVGQKKVVLDLCEKLKERFSEVNVPEICTNLVKLSSSEVSSNLVFVNGRSRDISLDQIIEPGFEEYGASVIVSGNNFTTVSMNMVRGIRYPLANKGEYVELVSVEDDSIIVNMKVERSGTDVLRDLFSTTERIPLRSFKAGIGDNRYRIDLQDLNLEKEAVVSIVPNIDDAGSTVDFGYQIGIEKRETILSPEKTQSLINDLNKTIEEWQDKSDKLGETVKTLKTACLAVGTWLTVQNFFTNLGGAGIARQKVMRSPGGWRDQCQQAVSAGTYSSQDECYVENAGKIESDVQAAASVIEAQNEVITEQDQADTLTSGGLFQDDVVNTDKYLQQATPRVNGLIGGTETVYNDPLGKMPPINAAEIKSAVTYDNWKEDRTFTQAQLRDIEYNERILASSEASESLKSSARADLYNIYSDIKVNSADVIKVREEQDKANQFGLSGIGVSFAKTEGTIKEVYDGYATPAGGVPNTQIPGGVPLTQYIYKGQTYYLELQNPRGGSVYGIKNIYTASGFLILDEEGNIVQERGEIDKQNAQEIRRNVQYQRLDKQSLQNIFVDPEVKYYETEPYEGLPAIVPFSNDEGWYAATRQTIPVGGAVRSFDQSGRISSFYLCNVGSNGRAEFFSGIGDDHCELVNLGTGQAYNQFPGLSSSESSKLVSCGVEAIRQASSKHSSGISGTTLEIKTNCGSATSKVTSPAVNLPDVECQDFMSPRQCQLMFNVCDPVVCPSSRCDLGGAFPVKDPIQTGIIGGLTLCLPNFKEGVYVPICLSGVKAGIDGLLSVYKSYQGCLQESLDTGKQVGICDEIYSVHLCEMFWRQGSQFAQVLIPRAIAALTGSGGSRGGGEYLNVQNAWTTASGSVDFFTQNYGANSFASFKARSTEEIGSLICQTSVSGTYPSQGNLLDQLTEPDSPPQFHGRFDEIPFTTTTNPPISQYKVWYHIFAGEESGAYYRVYLRPSSQGSFFQDTSVPRIVGQGFIPAGETVDETSDFTAPAGFKELCINVNGQEECGFKEVTTSFAFDYINDLRDDDIATQKDIRTEAECVSGGVSAYSLVNPSISSAGEELINPAIYNRGIIRTCATGNPGNGTDGSAGGEGSRWVEVGICGDTNLKCWLDTNSVKDVIVNTDIEGQTLSELNESTKNLLFEEGRYENDFPSRIEEIEDEDNREAKLELINALFENVYLNKHKAELLLRRGNLYSVSAVEAYQELLKALAGDREEYVQREIDAGELLQEQTITAIYENVPISEILDDLTLRSGVFFEEGPGLSSSDSISINVVNADYVELLEQYFEYEIKDGAIIVNSLRLDSLRESPKLVGSEEQERLDGLREQYADTLSKVETIDSCKLCFELDGSCSADECEIIGNKIKNNINSEWTCEFANPDPSDVKFGIGPDCRTIRIPEESSTEIGFDLEDYKPSSTLSFLLTDGAPFGGDIYYRFNINTNKWEVSAEEEQWFTMVSVDKALKDTTTVTSTGRRERVTYTATNPAVVGKEMRKHNEVISDLVGKDYFSGINVLVNAVGEDAFGGIGVNLIQNSITANEGSGDFAEFEAFNNGQIVFFYNQDLNRWEWANKGDNLNTRRSVDFDVDSYTWTVGRGGSTQKLTESVRNKIKSLRGKSYAPGIRELYRI